MPSPGYALTARFEEFADMEEASPAVVPRTRARLLRCAAAATLSGALFALVAGFRPATLRSGSTAGLSVKQQQYGYGDSYGGSGYGEELQPAAPLGSGQVAGAAGNAELEGSTWQAAAPVGGTQPQPIGDVQPYGTAPSTGQQGYGQPAGEPEGSFEDSFPVTAEPIPQRPLHGRPSLYCFALIMPSGGEVKLLQYQLENRLSLFLCNEYGVFSNMSFVLGPDSRRGGEALTTVPIGISLDVPHGGRWGTALNTDVFVMLWRKVAQVGRWEKHDWTVKLDADAVFLPSRLLTMVRRMPQPGPKYLNNCKWGMHGPIEVLTRAALSIYFGNMDTCHQIQRDAMEWQPLHWSEKMLRYVGNDTEHSFGEDQYLRRCLRLLNVVAVNEYELLDEYACGGRPKQKGCKGHYVTYHAFKKVSQYRSCLNYALTLEQR